MTQIQMIPLAQLRLSSRNVRRTGDAGVDELAASISAEGLLNNLVVTAANDGHFEVADGGRRLLALQSLQRDGKLSAALAQVQCLVVDDERATEAGLTANIMRKAMHPADEFAAFRQLAEEGKTVDEIAERFGASPRHIQQRLKLANVKPDLFEAYRAGSMNLDQLMALASTDNHELQRQAWDVARSDAERDARSLRNFIHRETAAADSAVARYVTVEAYEAAGGAVRRDLFSDQAYLTDIALLEKLAMQRLEERAQALRAAGWSWVEAHLTLDYAKRGQYGQHPRYWSAQNEVFASPQDEQRHSDITDRIEQIETAMDEVDDDSDAYSALNAEYRKLEAERDAIDERMHIVFPADIMAQTGVLVFVGSNGQLQHEYARLTPGQSTPKGSAKAAPATVKEAAPALSASVLESLSAHRSAVVRFYLAKDPTLAQCVLLERMLQAAWRDVHARNGLRLSFENVTDTTKIAEVHPTILAGLTAMDQVIQSVPKKGTLAHLLKQPEKWRMELQAILVARQFDGVSNGPDGHAGARAIHEVVGFNMADHWTAETDNFIGRIHPNLLAQAVTEAKGKEAAVQLKDLKKADRIALGRKLLAGTGWLPVQLRGPGYGEKSAGASTTSKASSAKPKPTEKAKASKKMVAPPKKAPQRVAKKAASKKPTKPAARKTAR